MNIVIDISLFQTLDQNQGQKKLEDPLGTCLVDDHSFNRWLCCFTFLASDDDGDLAMAAVMSLALFWAAGIWIVAALKKLGIPFNVVYKWYTLRIYI